MLDMARGLFAMSAVCTLPVMIKLMFGRPPRPPEPQLKTKSQEPEDLTAPSATEGKAGKKADKRTCYNVLWLLVTLMALLIQVCRQIYDRCIQLRNELNLVRFNQRSLLFIFCHLL